MRWYSRSARLGVAHSSGLVRWKRFGRRRVWQRHPPIDFPMCAAAAWLLPLWLLLSPVQFPDPLQHFVYRKLYAMGTVYEVLAYGSSLDRVSVAIDAALGRIVYLDHVMSNFDSRSDLSRLNRSAHFRAVAVPPDLYRVIQDSLDYSRLSNGEFDITVAPLVDAWKAAQADGVPPTPSEIDKLRHCIGYKKVQLIAPDRIEFHSGCMRIDLGAIGKGYAVDQAVSVLRSGGVREALLNAGGSTLYGMGSPPGEAGWRVRLRDLSGYLDPEVVLREDSVSTSEQGRTSLVQQGSFGHIIDPLTGRPARSREVVSVVASSATATDGLSTTLFLMGSKEGAKLVKTLPNLAAIWVTPAGEFESASTGPQIFVHDARAKAR